MSRVVTTVKQILGRGKRTPPIDAEYSADSLDEITPESTQAANTGVAPPEFGTRLKVSPKLAWEYEYIDNQYRQLMNQIYNERSDSEYIGSGDYFDMVRGELESDDFDPTPIDLETRAKIDYANKNPHMSAIYTHYLVANWGFQEGHRGIPVIQRGLSAAKREIRFLKYKYSGDDYKKSFLESEVSKLVNQAQNELDTTSWQYHHIRDLLTKKGSDEIKDNIELSDVMQAWEIMDDTLIHRSETYNKLAGQFNAFLGGSIISMISLVIYYITLPAMIPVFEGLYDTLLNQVGISPSYNVWEALGPLSSAHGPSIYIAVVLFALLGASISGLFSLRGLSPNASYPSETLALEKLAYARMVLGIAAGLIVFMFLDSGLLTISVETITVGTVLLLTFLAGFSERLLSKAINTSLGGAEIDIQEDPYLRQEREG
ncbi:hypothetical protein [Natronococcus wangiae]|uniref:hypothetical protein n=1 Tax=Natronococcus wangiae TaxID=3068275 RepID=UPI00273FD1A7|nr:hypothetical protein [Natronococcus sp. AD5]